MWPFSKQEKKNLIPTNSNQAQPQVQQSLPNLPQRELTEKEAWNILRLLQPHLVITPLRLSLDEAEILKDYATLQINLTPVSPTNFAIRFSWKQVFNQMDIYLLKAKGKLEKNDFRLEGQLQILANAAMYRLPIVMWERLKEAVEAMKKSPQANQVLIKNYEELAVKLNNRDEDKIKENIGDIAELFKDWLTPSAPNDYNTAEKKELWSLLSQVAVAKERLSAFIKTQQLTALDVKGFWNYDSKVDQELLNGFAKIQKNLETK